MREAEGHSPLCARYLAEVRRHPLLAPAEERELARRMRELGCLEARRRLITGNLRFVVKVARAYRAFGAPLIELVQEGNCGLTVAVDRFDPGRGVRLVTYAAWWIRAYIQAHIMRAFSVVRVGTTQLERRLFFRLAGAGQSLDAAAGAALAQHLGVAVERVRKVAARVGARDVPWEGAAATWAGQSGERRRLDELAIAGEERRRLASALAQLTPRLSPAERTVLDGRMLREAPPTLEAMGRRLGLSRERVRQLEGRIVERLRLAVMPGGRRRRPLGVGPALR